MRIDYIYEKVKPEQIPLCEESHKILEFMRSVFEDDTRIQKILSIQYENVIWSKLKLIPVMYIPDVLKITGMVIEFLQLLNIEGMVIFLSKYNLYASFDSKRFASEFISSTEMIPEKIAGLILNLIESFDKIFVCFDILINDPVKYLSKLCKRDGGIDPLK